MSELLGVFFIILVPILGWQFRLLTISGLIAASLIGLLILMGYGVEGLIIIGSFFASSSIWSKYKANKKEKAQDKNAKSDRRDWTQVLANGGVAAFSALLGLITGNEVFYYSFVVGLAAANADTWASEIGVLSRREPFHLLKLRRVERGTSGAVSILGLFASLAGSSFVVIVALFVSESAIIHHFIPLILLGFCGSIIDTLIGAGIQVHYKCTVCGTETEKPIHCSLGTKRIAGIRYVNNEVVNFISGVIPATVAYFIFS
ncbi:DUF92 domain-containing protein [Bacillus solimangrovi]|uniref:DUF92 domain-containing protein n=1 Tax=Bacillus solimangrovi TaxID=1305675 RepID=UPI000ACDE12D|nr:DUF92 domain-containing protein [Bacillus solimangrovi]